MASPDFRQNFSWSCGFFLTAACLVAEAAPTPTATNFSATLEQVAANPAQICGFRNRCGGTSIAALNGKMRFLRRRAAPGPREDPLAEVLEAEKAAAAAIAAAKLEAETWLEAERQAISAATDANLQALAARAAENEAAARRAAIADAAKVIAAADTFSHELNAISDRDLSPIVARHVASIIPGPPP